MRAQYIMMSLLMALLLFATGATRSESGAASAKPETVEVPVLMAPKENAVRQLERWQRAADVAFANKQFLVAYPFYEKIVQVYPNTWAAQRAASRGDECIAQLRNPDRFPAWEDWRSELRDTFTWSW